METAPAAGQALNRDEISKRENRDREIKRAAALGCRLRDLLIGNQLRKAVTARSLGEAASRAGKEEIRWPMNRS